MLMKIAAMTLNPLVKNEQKVLEMTSSSSLRSLLSLLSILPSGTRLKNLIRSA